MVNLEHASFLVCCANGAGTSLMMKMTLDKVLKKVGIQADKVRHCNLKDGQQTALEYDVIFVGKEYADLFAAAAAKGVYVLPLKNLLSVQEMETAMRNAGLIA